MQPKFAESNQDFSTGAKRGSQSGKPRPDLTSPYAALRKGIVSAHGAEHYGDRNWEKGMPFSRVIASAERHLMAYKMGKTDEDHLAQLGWNIDALLHFEEMVKLGLLPKELDDLPRYETKKDNYEAIIAEELAKAENGTVVAVPSAEPYVFVPAVTPASNFYDESVDGCNVGGCGGFVALLQKRREQAVKDFVEQIHAAMDRAMTPEATARAEAEENGRRLQEYVNSLPINRVRAAALGVYAFVSRQVWKVRSAIADKLVSVAQQIDPDSIVEAEYE